MPCPVPSAPPPPPLLPSPPTFQSKDSTPTTAISAFSAAPNLPSSHSPVRWSTGLCDCCEDVSRESTSWKRLPAQIAASIVVARSVLSVKSIASSRTRGGMETWKDRDEEWPFLQSCKTG
ncbi:hypothetical protein U1Q18_029537 [Sarracenia purpurea var. burkii]